MLESASSPPGAAARCPNCGAPRPERFCPRCGERRLEREDYSLRGYAREVVSVLANLDHRIFRTLRALLTRPGALTVEYFAGRRSRYLLPLQIYLLISLAVFFLTPRTGVFGYDLEQYLRYSRLAPIPAEMVQAHLAETGESLAEFRARFDEAIQSQKKALLLLLVPLFALLLFPLYPRAHRVYVEYLVFSVHLFAGLLLYIAVLLPFLLWLIRQATSLLLPGPDPRWLMVTGRIAILLLTTATVSTYIFLALRRVYGDSKIATTLRTAALLVALWYLVVWVYREALFFTTFYAVT